MAPVSYKKHMTRTEAIALVLLGATDPKVLQNHQQSLNYPCIYHTGGHCSGCGRNQSMLILDVL